MTNEEAIWNAQCQSVMFNGDTHKSVVEVEIVYSRLLLNGCAKNIYIQLVPVEHAHTEGVTQAIEDGTTTIDFEWKNKLVATNYLNRV